VLIVGLISNMLQLTIVLGDHMAAELLKMMAGVDLVHVPYRGVAPALNDLIVLPEPQERKPPQLQRA
jgi:hypothetical protein